MRSPPPRVFRGLCGGGGEWTEERLVLFLGAETRRHTSQESKSVGSETIVKPLRNEISLFKNI